MGIGPKGCSLLALFFVPWTSGKAAVRICTVKGPDTELLFHCPTSYSFQSPFFLFRASRSNFIKSSTYFTLGG